MHVALALGSEVSTAQQSKPCETALGQGGRLMPDLSSSSDCALGPRGGGPYRDGGLAGGPERG
jgi:hypothetical protein